MPDMSRNGRQHTVILSALDAPPPSPCPCNAAEDQPPHVGVQPQLPGSPTPGAATAATGYPSFERPNLSLWLEQLEELPGDFEPKWGMQPREAPAGVGMDEGRRDFVDAVRRCLLLYAQVRRRPFFKDDHHHQHQRLRMPMQCTSHPRRLKPPPLPPQQQSDRHR